MKLLTTLRNFYTHFVCNLVYCVQKTEWRFCLHPLAGRVITQTSVKHSAPPLSDPYCVFLQLRVLFESTLQVTLLPVIAKLILISSQSLIKGLHSRSKLERWQMKVATLPKTGCFTVPKSSEHLVFTCFICRIALLNLLINTNLLQTLRSNAVNSLNKLADSFSTLCDSQLQRLRQKTRWELLVPERYISIFSKWAWSLPNQVMRTPGVVHLF